MSMRAPGSEVTSPALGNQGMDVRIPFQIPPEGMQDADKARSKVFGLVKLEEHTQDDIPDRMKQAVKKGMVLKKKDAEFFRNGKDTMPVNAGNQFTGHTKSPFLIIHVATGRTETAFTGKRDKFKVPTMRAAKESAAKRRIMAMDHLVNVIQNIFARAEHILDVLIKSQKDKPPKPLMSEGQGS